MVYVAKKEPRDQLASVDFADLCITSGVTVKAGKGTKDAFTLDEVEGVAVVPSLAEGEKCQRCWKILPDVGSHKHPGVCGRCNDALTSISFRNTAGV